MQQKKITFLAPAFFFLLFLVPFLARGASEWIETPIIATTPDQINPSVSDCRIVWQDYRNKATGCPSAQNCLAADVFAQDLSTGSEQRLTSSPNGLDPDISGDIVVWRNWDTGKIVYHDLGTGAEGNVSIAGGTVQQVMPAASGNRVVWTDYRNSSDYGDIFMRDLGAPSDQAVALGDPALAVPKRDKRNPDIDGDIVVWEDWRNAYQDAQGWWHNPDIYAKDVSTGVEYAVCTDPGDQYTPVVSGGRVFWQDYRNGNWDIYMKDLSTGQETRLSTSNAHQSWPSAAGDFVVWKDARNGDEDVYLKRISTGSEQMVNSDPAANPGALQKLPVIDGTDIAWMDSRDGNWNIYAAHDGTPPQITPTSPAGQTTVTDLTISADLAEAGTAVDTASVSVALDGLPLAACAVSEASVSCAASGIGQGPHSFTIAAADVAGNTTAYNGSFEVDSIGPQITNPAPSGWLDAGSFTVTAGLSDNYSGVDAATVRADIDGVPLTGCTAGTGSVSCPATGITDGSHIITISALDSFGNPGSATTQVTVDSQAPVISSLQVTHLPPYGAHIDVSYADAGIGVNESLITVSVDGLPLSGCVANAGSASCDADGLSLGDHTVSVSVPDDLGHVATAQSTLSIIDAVAPVVTPGSPSGVVAAGTVLISASYSDDPPSGGIDAGSVTVAVDGAALSGCAADASSVSCQTILEIGLHEVTVTVRDASGNEGTAVWSFNLGEVPVVSNPQPAPGSLVNNPLAKISADYADNGRGIDDASIRMYLDGVEITGSAVQEAGSVSFTPGSGESLADGPHAARFVVADTMGGTADYEWTFNVTHPQLSMSLLRVYWASYAAYVARELSVDYRLTDPADGACRSVKIEVAFASNGVIASTPLPFALGDVNAHTSVDYSFVYLVPNGVTKFSARSHISCLDDGNNVYWFPGLPPEGPSA